MSAPAPPSILVGTDVRASTKSSLSCISKASSVHGRPGATSVAQATWIGVISRHMSGNEVISGPPTSV